MIVWIYYKQDSVRLDLQYSTLTSFVEDFKAKGWWYVEVDVRTKTLDADTGEIVHGWGKQDKAIPWHSVTEIKRINL